MPRRELCVTRGGLGKPRSEKKDPQVIEHGELSRWAGLLQTCLFGVYAQASNSLPALGPALCWMFSLIFSWPTPYCSVCKIHLEDTFLGLLLRHHPGAHSLALCCAFISNSMAEALGRTGFLVCFILFGLRSLFREFFSPKSWRIQFPSPALRKGLK